MKQKVKRKIHKTSDPGWDTHTYSGSSKNPFNIEWLKHYNPMEGKDQIIFLYTDKETKKIMKHRIL